MSQFKIKMKRVHTCDGQVVSRRIRSVSLNAIDINEAIEQAFDRAYGAQYLLFGDTGMDDGEYKVTILTVNGQQVEFKSTGWEMKYPKSEE